MNKKNQKTLLRFARWLYRRSPSVNAGTGQLKSQLSVDSPQRTLVGYGGYGAAGIVTAGNSTITKNRTYAGQLIAHTDREDLLKAGLGSSHHAFEVPCPPGHITLHRAGEGAELGLPKAA